MDCGRVSGFPTIGHSLTLLLSGGMRFTRVRGVTCRARGGLLGRISLFSICRNGGLRTKGGSCTIDFLLRSRDRALGSGVVSGVVSGLIGGLRSGLKTGLEWACGVRAAVGWLVGLVPTSSLG